MPVRLKELLVWSCTLLLFTFVMGLFKVIRHQYYLPNPNEASINKDSYNNKKIR